MHDSCIHKKHIITEKRLDLRTPQVYGPEAYMVSPMEELMATDADTLGIMKMLLKVHSS